jgi:hypothetical protein
MQKSSSTPPTVDTRIVCGATCSWWDDICEVGISTGHALPCCPHCGGVLYEYPTMETFMSGAIIYDNKHPGYLNVLHWTRGRCFPSFEAACKAYNARNHLGPFSREFLGK